MDPVEDTVEAQGDRESGVHLTFECPEWRAFLLRQYQHTKQHNPNASLRSVYPIAKRMFLCKDKQCDVHLELISNQRRHKRKK